ncbi:Type 1 glutamine amidotransferase-like domain-containing protein [Tessaracoccus sp. G1721]
MPTRPGAVHLVGGGRDEDAVVTLLIDFVAQAAALRGDGSVAPRIHALLVLEADDREGVERYGRLLGLAGANVDVHAIVEGELFDASALDGADAIFVGGGLTPAYLDAFASIAPLVRDRVAAGMPYLGFSAGAAIAPERAVIGGHLVDGVPVCDEDASEELDEVAVSDGLGLVPFTVDVHAAQWGTLSRLVAAVGAGLVERGLAIDEHTSIRWDGVDDPASSVAGRGAVWQVSRADAGGSVLVSRSRARMA